MASASNQPPSPVAAPPAPNDRALGSSSLVPWEYIALLVASVAATAIGIGIGLFGGGPIPGLIANVADPRSILMGGVAVLGVALASFSLYQIFDEEKWVPFRFIKQSELVAGAAPPSGVEVLPGLANGCGPLTAEEHANLEKIRLDSKEPIQLPENAPFIFRHRHQPGFYVDRDHHYQNPGNQNNCALNSAVAAWIYAQYRDINFDHPYVKYVIYKAAYREREFCADWLIEQIKHNDPAIKQALLLVLNEVDPSFSPLEASQQEIDDRCIRYINEVVRTPGRMCSGETHLAMSQRWGCTISVYGNLDRGEGQGRVVTYVPQEPIQGQKTLSIIHEGAHYTTYLLPPGEVAAKREALIAAEMAKKEKEIEDKRNANSEKLVGFYTSGEKGPGGSTLAECQEQLEDPRNFAEIISWLFPLRRVERSYNARNEIVFTRETAPLLDETRKKDIDTKLVTNSFDRTLQIFGLKREAGAIIPIADAPQREFLSRPENSEEKVSVSKHLYQLDNQKGILIRIIQSLKEFGLNELSKLFENYLATIPQQYDALIAQERMTEAQKAILRDKKADFEKILQNKDRNLALLVAPPPPVAPAPAAAAAAAAAPPK